MAESEPQRALRDYAELYDAIEALDHIIDELHIHGDDAVQGALQRIGRLLIVLADFVDLEHTMVLPTLRDSDVWREFGAGFRAGPRAVTRRLGQWVDPGVLAVDLSELVHMLRDELRHRDERVGREPTT